MTFSPLLRNEKPAKRCLSFGCAHRQHRPVPWFMVNASESNSRKKKHTEIVSHSTMPVATAAICCQPQKRLAVAGYWLEYHEYVRRRDAMPMFGGYSDHFYLSRRCFFFFVYLQWQNGKLELQYKYKHIHCCCRCRCCKAPRLKWEKRAKSSCFSMLLRHWNR